MAEFNVVIKTTRDGKEWTHNLPFRPAPDEFITSLGLEVQSAEFVGPLLEFPFIMDGNFYIRLSRDED